MKRRNLKFSPKEREKRKKKKNKLNILELSTGNGVVNIEINWKVSEKGDMEGEDGGQKQVNKNKVNRTL